MTSTAIRRRLTSPPTLTRDPLPSCTLAALDLDLSSYPTPSLAALRDAVLTYLTDLEHRLANADPDSLQSARALLARIRADVSAHLPAAGDLIPDFNARLKDARAHLTSQSHPAHYLPLLRQHLHALHTHLAAYAADPSVPASALLDRFLASDFAPAVLHRENGQASTLEKAAADMRVALKKSLDGSRLVTYVDLPDQWRSNPWVTSGYRFIPLHKWPVILFSIFMLHNETLNIHTHMIPFLYKATHLVFSLNNTVSNPIDRPETLYTIFAMFCLLASVIWHTMAGCAHLGGMELCARVDYVGIGWLISASIGTVVYYGFSCDSQSAWLYLSLCLAMGITGSVFPFMAWFNERKYKSIRVLFFLSMALVGLAPLVHLATLHGPQAVMRFISPLSPSFASYLIGLAFYVSHFPERYICQSLRMGTEKMEEKSGSKLDSNSKSAHVHSAISTFTSSNAHKLGEMTLQWTDWLGGGSHALWHLCIVVAIFQHRWGMRDTVVRAGLCGV